MKKFEPHYRLVRVGAAQKIEKASRQQRMLYPARAMTALFGAFQPNCRTRLLILDIAPQGNNERTDRRNFAVPQRRRVHRRTRRRNKRVFVRGVCGGVCKGGPKLDRMVEIEVGTIHNPVVSACAADPYLPPPPERHVINLYYHSYDCRVILATSVLPIIIHQAKLPPSVTQESSEIKAVCMHFPALSSHQLWTSPLAVLHYSLPSSTVKLARFHSTA